MNQYSAISSSISDLLRRFARCRALTEKLCENLSDADATVQSMEDASPAKWHLAHTSWFFETFILRDHAADYTLFDKKFPFLFNSYYEAEGARHSRFARGLITRPTLDEILSYRTHVTKAIHAASADFSDEVWPLIELGIHHEQQHQELLLTDILHLFSCNPTHPAIWPKMENKAENKSENKAKKTNIETAAPVHWINGPDGIASIGYDPKDSDLAGDSFAFDCEGPAHDILLTPYAMADRTVTNGEWLKFINDGAYQKAQYWLSDGWAWVNKEAIHAPLYWVERDDGWYQFGLDGLHSLDLHAPVTHISLYEADAFASWAAENLAGYQDARLPTEGEWEALVRANDFDADIGHQLDAAGPVKANSCEQSGQYDFFGNNWEWTGSAFRPYPKFSAAKGAIGEYNGKFMSGQFVLKGGSCATPREHLRASYRNFFYPHHRWQFTGLRLAKYLGNHSANLTY